MIILGIETSCDETAVALLQTKGCKLKVLSDTVSSQIKLHAKWGGVVPNLAAREHVKNILPVLDATLIKAALSQKDIDLIAVTQGPGLIPALLIGTSAAKTLAYLWKKPLMGIHHIEGHIYANFIQDEISAISNNHFPISKHKKIKFPILCLVVSGGHTQLVLMKKHLDYQIIGQTLDDAAGEAFDKVARILGLGYPGGPAIAAKAAELEIKNYALKKDTDTLKINELKKLITLPRPMLNKNNFDFSFSGLKTAVLYKIKSLTITEAEKLKTNLCHEFQQAVIDVLIAKTIKAAEKFKPETILLAGGVSANTELRQQLGDAIHKNLPRTRYYQPATNYCIDNAAMIATAAFFRWQKMNAAQKNKCQDNWQLLEANANLVLK